MKHIIILLLVLRCITVVAQTDWQEALQQWMSTEEMEGEYGTEVMELLAECADTPINLNQATRQQLEALPFLTARQVEEIIAYRDRYAPMRSLSELLMITSLDWSTRQLLEHFVCIGDAPPQRTWPRLQDLTKNGRHTLIATGKIPLYERKGDQNGYLGYRYRHDLRYQFNYANRVKFGLTAAQDAGEPFFANSNRWGYDHYSYYLQMRDMGRIEELNLGMFRVQMGLGLVMNTGFSLGKTATLQQLGRTSHTVSAHTSRVAANYLQGAAATIRLHRRWKATAFASYRPIDATLNKDGTARTLLTDGYHRTPTEMAKKHNTHETDLGVSIGYRKGTLHINANAVFTSLSRRLTPQKETTLYRRYAAEGSSFMNASLDYGYTNTRLSISGETAVNGRGALALINTVSCRMSQTLTLMGIHRYYDKRYTALHARGFSEGNSIQNEHGIYTGLTWQPARSWLVQTYVDYAHFCWARYLVSASSDAFDGTLAARYQQKAWTIDGHYRMHLRQRDNSQKTALANRYEHRLRLGATWQPSPTLSLHTQADGSMLATREKTSRGIMLSQQAAWQWRWLRAKALAGWFHTDDYDSRIYRYEHSVAYDFSFPMYYGHGIRYSLMAQADIGKKLKVTARIAVTNYFDRQVISSGLQQIGHSSMTDLTLQAKWAF